MKKSLAATNPYLRNQALKRKMVRRFVTSSSAIEGIHVTHYRDKKSASSKKQATTSRRKA